MTELVTQLRIMQSDYLEMLYFFALKKTGDKKEAEELAQDIVTEAFFSLSRGSQPEQFGPWLWAIARNRYARWVDGRKRSTLMTASDEMLIDTTVAPGLSVEGELIWMESLELLKRELSLLTADYRNITVAYYIHGCRISEIATKQGMPEGTIKRRLYETREHLREGMEMAREKGQRSYLAENVHFGKSGMDGKNGSPWSLLQRLIPKNVLLAAYRNPLTMEELCLDLGVAMPYMEEEVRLLTEGTLLKEVSKGKYETDFIIVDKDMRLDIFQEMVERNKQVSPLLLDLLDRLSPSLNLFLSYGKKMVLEDAYWTLIPLLVNFLADEVKAPRAIPSQYTDRPHGGKWDIAGYEDCALPLSVHSSHDGNNHGHAHMTMFKFSIDRLWDRAGELSSYEANLLGEVFLRKRKFDELSDIQQRAIRNLMHRGFVHDNETDLHPTFLVFANSKASEGLQLVKDSEGFGELVSIMMELYDFIHVRIGRNVPARLNNQLKFVSHQFLFDMRMFAIRSALEQDRIAIPANPEKSTIGMYMMLA